MIEEARGLWERSKMHEKYSLKNNERWKNATSDPGAPPKEDFFGPISSDPNCMKLAPDVKVTFVGNEEQVIEMEEVLRNSTFLGLNAKSRHYFYKRKRQVPVLFQICNKNAAFLIDLVALANNAVLDKVLTSLFENE